MPRKVVPITDAPSLRGGGTSAAGGKPVIAAASDVEAMVKRDQWDRPLIIPPGGEGKPVAYRRASTVSEELEDHFGLNRWKQRLEAEGLAAHPELVNAIHTASRSEVGKIVEEAIELAGGSTASRNGSTMHALTDRLDRGADMPSGLPAHIVAMLEAYEEATKHLKVLDSERFVVQDKIHVAGTYDRRVYDPRHDMELIADLKTGQSLDHLALKTPAQVAVYASGVHYSLDGERERHDADRDRGLLIWLPWTEEPSEAMCEIRWLDLRVGRQAILEAIRINNIRKLKYTQTMPLYR